MATPEGFLPRHPIVAKGAATETTMPQLRGSSFFLGGQGAAVWVPVVSGRLSPVAQGWDVPYPCSKKKNVPAAGRCSKWEGNSSVVDPKRMKVTKPSLPAHIFKFCPKHDVLQEPDFSKPF